MYCLNDGETELTPWERYQYWHYVTFTEGMTKTDFIDPILYEWLCDVFGEENVEKRYATISVFRNTIVFVSSFSGILHVCVQNNKNWFNSNCPFKQEYVIHRVKEALCEKPQ